jgi:NADP-dependent 3-hydroxy acid dehydrogenase YdfG
MNAKPLENTVAVVTGASSGIGAATATTLAASGAKVALVARRRDKLEALQAQIHASGSAALVVQADITDKEQVVSAVSRIAEHCGRIDILVNNAGTMTMGPTIGANTEDWDHMLAINVNAVLYMSHACLPHLVAAAVDSPRGVADLVNISSTAGRVARPGNGVYALSKFGVNAFSESLRQELIDKRVRVSVVEPGIVETELNAHIPEQLQETVKKMTENVRRLQPVDVAEAVQFIVSRANHVAVNEVLIRAAEQTW